MERTADGHDISVGDRLFNYYDCKWGKVVGPIMDNGWFLFEHEDGTKTDLNGERVAKTKPSWMK
jgi:hypothetical protein